MSYTRPGGLTTSMTYGDAEDLYRLQTMITSGSQGVISNNTYQYEPKTGLMTSWHRDQLQADGTVQSDTYGYTYDSEYQLQSATLTDDTTGQMTQNHSYVYDAVGNRLSHKNGNEFTGGVFNGASQQTLTTPSGVIDFNGSTNRPVSSVRVDGQLADLNLNGEFSTRVNVMSGLNTHDLVIEENDGTIVNKTVTHLISPTDGSILSYDANGNLIRVASQLSPSAPSREYEWDALNRLTCMIVYQENGQRHETDFAYNYKGEQVIETTRIDNGDETMSKALWLGGSLHQRRDADDKVIVTYTGNGQRTYDTAGSSSSTDHFYTSDSSGSVRAVTNSSGSVIGSYDYSPYGERSTTSGSFSADKGYGGLDYHAPSGNTMVPSGAYDSQQGRWLSPHTEGGYNPHGRWETGSMSEEPDFTRLLEYQNSTYYRRLNPEEWAELHDVLENKAGYPVPPLTGTLGSGLSSLLDYLRGCPEEGTKSLLGIVTDHFIGKYGDQAKTVLKKKLGLSDLFDIGPKDTFRDVLAKSFLESWADDRIDTVFKDQLGSVVDGGVDRAVDSAFGNR